MTGPRIAWNAASDGVGHALIGVTLRTPCGRRPVDPRMAWPITSRCETCTAAVAAANEAQKPTASPRPA